ncbi:TetR/AcrR family transcriptional regulator [Myxococcus landrumensis]|uniref:TetR/AcrR family transcriptional regulator n=1 Tax=Myxococcus landrumensis TaxID=2813577 RepID=A0ABX7NCB8_9BACT|nr:TetR/AcrR family transcriptional regulator [Myxococcus landrumus]QSQ16063.1 TetR/AcrR family transcriptional regulator [Myxococcus landrumus]
MRTTMVYQWYTMPLPRFLRLPKERQREILAIARAHFARDGIEGASYNQIISDAGISKTAAYQYFDGKDDLAATVLAEVKARVLGVLGTWEAATSARAFWERLRLSSARLVDHLAKNPEDLALLGAAPGGAPDEVGLAWFEAVVDDGLRLGVIRNDVDRALLLGVTRAFFQAADAWALQGMHAGATVDTSLTWSLLEGLWSPRKGARQGGTT